MKRQIGVDFGTTTSVVCYRDFDENNRGDIKFIEFGSDKTRYTPTCILKSGEYTGRKGKKRTIQKEKYGWEAYYNTMCYELLETDFKMKLLSGNPEENEEARKWTKKFFSYLHEEYSSGWVSEAAAALEEINTYVTYPGRFSMELQQFLKTAAEEAGFPNVVMINEAVAAMHYVITHDNEKSADLFQTSIGKQKIMLIDMGAGTTDITVFEYDRQNPEKFRLLSDGSTDGKTNFGGREIDDILCRFYKAKIHPELAGLIGADQGGSERLGEVMLRDWVKRFKESVLSGSLKADECIEDEMPGNLFSYAEKYSSDYSAMELDRCRFEAIHKEYLEDFPKMIEGAVSRAGLQGSEIDFVILTGGHSRWYFVEELLCGESGCLTRIKADNSRVISYDENANYVVSAGATYYSSLPEPKPRFEEPPQSVEEPAYEPKTAACDYDCFIDFFRKCNNCRNCNRNCIDCGDCGDCYLDNCIMDSCTIWCERDF